ncbi:glycosyltransferase family 2 protein [uncultured Bacteroides sp.]|uniref:glycosyltransferase family 2 protein n=1 Tax=uncultured Bacteroides sp. TaxID=162156 RepID=UPI0025975896|nr:glycosyltransferase family 2 protein [uncultured Bacteroides sp.]
MDQQAYLPLVSIVTVSYNAVTTIEETILSVVNQTYKNIEYIIIDGGSTDGTVDVIKKYQDQISFWISEPDNGMYDALRKGFALVHGEICCYINSDDFYYKAAIETVVDFFVTHINVLWIKGLDVTYNEKSEIIQVKVPMVTQKKYIKKGMYCGKYFPYIQQESVFWRTVLNASIDWDLFSKLRFAGDYYLWVTFSKITELHIVLSYLGGFRVRKGQLSMNLKEYLNELKMITSKPNYLDKLLAFYYKSIYVLFRDSFLYKKIYKSKIHYYHQNLGQFV